MSEESVKYHIAYQARKIEDLQSEIRAEMEDLQRVVAYALATKAYDSRIHQRALTLMEKDAKLRALEEAQPRLTAAFEAKVKETP